MNCGYQCHQVGGPWVAENPNCPVHGIDAQAEQRSRNRVKDELREQINNAETVADLRDCLHEILDQL